MEQQPGMEEQSAERSSRIDRFKNWAERITHITYTDLERMAEFNNRNLDFRESVRYLANPFKWVRKVQVEALGVHSEKWRLSPASSVDDVADLISRIDARATTDQRDEINRRTSWILALSAMNALVGIGGGIFSLISVWQTVGSIIYFVSGSFSGAGALGYRISDTSEVQQVSLSPPQVVSEAPEEPPSEPGPPPAEEPHEVEEPAVEAVDTRRNLRETLRALLDRALDALEAGRGRLQGVFPGRQGVEEGMREPGEPLPEVRPAEEAAPAEASPGEGQQPGKEINPEAEASRYEKLRDMDTGQSVPFSEYLSGERSEDELVDAEGMVICHLLGTTVRVQGTTSNTLFLYVRSNKAAYERVNDMAVGIYDLKTNLITGSRDFGLSEVLGHLRGTIQDLIESGFQGDQHLYDREFLDVINQHGVRLGDTMQEDQLQAVADTMVRILLGDTLYEAGTRERQGILRTVAGRVRGLWQRLGGGRRRAGDGQRTGGREESITAGQAGFGEDLSRYRGIEEVPEDLKQYERASLEAWMGVGDGESNTLRVLAQGDTTLGNTIKSAVNSVSCLKVDYMDDERTPNVPLTITYIIMFLDRLNTNGYILEGNMSGRFRALLPEDWQDGQRLDDIGIQQVANRLLRAWLGDDVYVAAGGEIEVRAAAPAVEEPEPPGLWARLREWRERRRRRGRRDEARDRTVENLRVPLDAYRTRDADRADLIQRERESFYALAGVEEEGGNTMRSIVEQDRLLRGILDDLSETVYLVKNDAAYTRYDEQNWNTVATQMWIFLEGLLRMPGVTEAVFSEDVRQILVRNRWESGRDLESERLQAAGREVLHLWLGDGVWGIISGQLEQTQRATAAPAETAGGSVEGFGAPLNDYKNAVRLGKAYLEAGEAKDGDKQESIGKKYIEAAETLDGPERERLMDFFGERARVLYQDEGSDFFQWAQILIYTMVEMKINILVEARGHVRQLYNREYIVRIGNTIDSLLREVNHQEADLNDAFIKVLNDFGVNLADPVETKDELVQAIDRITELWLGTDLYRRLKEYIQKT